MDLNDRFLAFIGEWVPAFREKTYLLAISGGLDSMCMLDLFHSNGLKIALAHCNFGLRAEESDGDQDFVEGSAKKLGLAVFTRKFNTKEYASASGLSTQMAARDLRYEWFAETLEDQGYDYLCTAHHLDDSLETVLFNLVRGTGISGLVGIRPLSGSTLRPLVAIPRSDLELYATDRGISWREDSSNLTTDYHRNFIRHKVMPLLKEINPAFHSNHDATLSRLRGGESVALDWVRLRLGDMISKEENAISLDLNRLREHSPDLIKLLLYTWLSPLGYIYAQVEDIYRGLGSGSGAIFYSGNHELVRDRHRLLLSEAAADGDGPWILVKGEQVIAGRKFQTATIDRAEWELDRDPRVIQLDQGRLQEPLELRIWQQGDRFFPLGMKGKKKISDFMIDRKIPINFKHRALLLMSGDEVAAVVGLAIDERFKVTDTTETVLVIKVEHA